MQEACSLRWSYGCHITRYDYIDGGDGRIESEEDREGDEGVRCDSIGDAVDETGRNKECEGEAKNSSTSSDESPLSAKNSSNSSFPFSKNSKCREDA